MREDASNRECHEDVGRVGEILIVWLLKPVYMYTLYIPLKSGSHLICCYQTISHGNSADEFVLSLESTAANKTLRPQLPSADTYRRP